MSHKVKTVVLGSLVAVLMLPSLVQTKVPSGRAVYLTATFGDAGTDINVSDGKGLYQNAREVTVQFTETGELQFIIGERASRRVNFVFGEGNFRGPGFCGDCAEPVPALPDEPTTYLSSRTVIGRGYKGPQLNFLAMTHGQVAPVRLGVYFETKTRDFFRLRYYNPADPDYGDVTCFAGGSVQVTALNTTGDPAVDCWIITPIPTDDTALFFREYDRAGNDWFQCSFGYYGMPFTLTLSRK